MFDQLQAARFVRKTGLAESLRTVSELPAKSHLGKLRQLRRMGEVAAIPDSLRRIHGGICHRVIAAITELPDHRRAGITLL
jgi:hypothetical protein